MSYKSTILSDYPLAYYPLDDMTTVDSVLDFTDLLSQYTSYQDVLDNFSSYANLYGDIAYDHSGCENDSNYIGDPAANILPIVVGNSRATKITSSNSIAYTINKNYTAQPVESNIATLSCSDADFSIEAWFKPSFATTGLTPIVADPDNNIGLFYQNGNIIFKTETEEIEYTLSYLNKAFHLVGTYTPNKISLYIDGVIAVDQDLAGFEFTNASLNLKSGPTLDTTDSFLLNSVGIYRYALSAAQIYYHYNIGLGLPPIQIASPENGELFEIYDDKISAVYSYGYPASKPFTSLVTDDFYYDVVNDDLILASGTGSKTVTIEDFIMVPDTTMDSSKIEWDGDNGISVETSVDGTTYVSCVNGDNIPQYKLGSFDTSNKLYIRITFTSSDASRYLPRLKYFLITFYNNQTKWASNGPSYITTLEGVESVGDTNLSFGVDKFPILSRDLRNGIKTVTNAGFYVNTSSPVSTLEFFYTPLETSDSWLIEADAVGSYSSAIYRWSSLGAITKTNIAAIYVNGINYTSETNAFNIFQFNDLNHVVIVFSNPISGQIKFDDGLYGSAASLIQNIILYQTAFTSSQATDHLNLWKYGQYSIIADNTTSSMSVTESAINSYDNGWLVIQSV